MIDPTAIRAAVEAFILADATYSAHGITAEERKIDLAIAVRTGDDDQIAAAKEAKLAHGKEWYPNYVECREAAKAIATTLGIDPIKLQRALPHY